MAAAELDQQLDARLGERQRGVVAEMRQLDDVRTDSGHGLEQTGEPAGPVGHVGAQSYAPADASFAAGDQVRHSTSTSAQTLVVFGVVGSGAPTAAAAMAAAALSGATRSVSCVTGRSE